MLPPMAIWKMLMRWLAAPMSIDPLECDCERKRRQSRETERRKASGRFTYFAVDPSS
jgi:hypothetical protein